MSSLVFQPPPPFLQVIIAQPLLWVSHFTRQNRFVECNLSRAERKKVDSGRKITKCENADTKLLHTVKCFGAGVIKDVESIVQVALSQRPQSCQRNCA